MSRKGENIYRRKDNRWEARYIKGYTEKGTIRFGYCYGKTYHEARRKAEQAKAEFLMEGEREKSAKAKFSAVCDEWLLLNRCRVKESTYVKYLTAFEKHIKPSLGEYRLELMSSVVVENFSHSLLYEKRLQPKTVKDILSLLHSVLKYAVRRDGGRLPYIEVNYPKEAKKEMRVLSREEQELFVDYLTDGTDSVKFGVLIALLTGLRIGELCALKWGDISIEERTVRVRRTMQRLKDVSEESGEKTRIIISEPKSSTSMRTIPLSGFVSQLCTEMYVPDGAAFVLTGQADKFIEPRSLQYRLGKYTEACGLEGVHFHTLRHTFATRCVEVDFELKSLSEILGHADPKITLQRYVHSSMELKRENMRKLESLGY